MPMHKRILPILILSITLMASLLSAGKEISSQDLYSRAINAYKDKKWKLVAKTTQEMRELYPEAPFLSDLYYYSGEAYYNIGEYDLANESLSNFLEKYASPNHFDDAMQYKFFIAQQYEKGARKHVFGQTVLPKWADAREDAYKIYEEVIQTAGRSEIAAKSLFQKGSMKKEDRQYKEAVLTFQALIRRFPKHHLAADSYVKIAEVYKEQLKKVSPDSDLLDLAQINYRKFAFDFPSEERMANVETMIGEMMDLFAEDLWKAAAYFDKKGKKSSAVLYYKTIVKRYPKSHYAHSAFERLAEMSELNIDEIASLETKLINL